MITITIINYFSFYFSFYLLWLMHFYLYFCLSCLHFCTYLLCTSTSTPGASTILFLLLHLLPDYLLVYTLFVMIGSMIVHCFWQSLFKTSPESMWQNFSLCEWSLMHCFVERELFHINKYQNETLTQTSNTLGRVLKWYCFLECCFLMIPSLSDDVFLQGFVNIFPLHWRSPQINTTQEKG